MKVSVCVTTFNHLNYIQECLDSILSQSTKFDFEVIVGDDCSKDGTVEILKKLKLLYGEKLKLILRDKNIGAFENSMDIRSRARGEYIAYCDGDDRWLPGKLQIQVDFLDENSNYSCCWSRVNFFSNDGGFLPGEAYDYSMFPKGDVEVRDVVVYGAVAVHSSIMYRASAAAGMKPFRDTLESFYSFYFLLSGKGKILNDVLAEYRLLVPGSMTSTNNLKPRELVAESALYYLMNYPIYRKEVFISSSFNMLVDLKNRRRTWIKFLLISCRSLSMISPVKMIKIWINSAKLRRPKLNY